MAREFVTRHGLSVSGKTYISTVDLNVNANSILVIDGNEVQYRDVSSLPDTFVTGGTLNSSTGTATFTNNTGGTFNVTGFFTSADTINIYNNNGTLSGDRIVNQDTNHLTFSGESGVSIGTGTTNPVCALLELASENQGLLIPRMTQSQRQAIPSPLPGLLVYCTDNTSNAKEGLYMYKSLGWVNIL